MGRTVNNDAMNEFKQKMKYNREKQRKDLKKGYLSKNEKERQDKERNAGMQMLAEMGAENQNKRPSRIIADESTSIRPIANIEIQDNKQSFGHFKTLN
jgi:hypothetical protein